MFKRKSTPPTVSPLAPPPQQHSQDRRMSMDGSQRGGRPAQGQGQGQGQGLIAGPAYNAGGPVDRVGSYDSSTMKSDKSERRRSGLFGFGKKDKDKDKDKEKELPRLQPHPENQPQGRGSFSVERGPGNHQPDLSAPAQAQYRPNSANNGVQQSFQPYPMHQFPPPQPGRTPPLPAPADAPGGRPMSQQPPPRDRVVSSPQSPPGLGSNDFGPYPSASQFPRSQTMGFPGDDRGGGRIPDTHPYRGFLNAQQDQNGGERSPSTSQQLPRSGSMPLDKPQSPPPQPISNGNSGQPSPNASSSFSNPNADTPNDRRLSQPSSRQASQSDIPPPQTIKQPPVSSGQPQSNQPSWQREFNNIVDLIGAQPNKHYVASPPELEMILARTSAGALPKQGQPGSASNDWDAVWLQLSGISLSMWSMKETRAAAAKGEKVPPTYFNITDSSLELLAPLPPPPHRPNSHPHHFVYSLNTAGSNRLLFSCPSERDLARWATGLRLAAWERARLEEIYTGHLIKTGGREPKMELVRGRMEGWVRVRVMGGTDWKRLWLVLSSPHSEEVTKEDEKKSRRRSIFGFGDKQQPEPVQEPNTGVSMASFYLEPRTQKNRATPAVLTMTDITQTYAVFPERLEVMSQSNLMKAVGRVNGELVTIEGRLRDSGWALMMPEAPGEGTASPPPSSPLANMMRWVTAFHDVFGLYGRPERYIWDPSNPKSFFFAYPEGPDRTNLFLDTDEALGSEFRTASLPAIRASFVDIVKRKMSEPAVEYRDEKGSSSSPAPRPDGDYRLPPLTFDRPSPNMSSESQPRSLTPITERTDDASRQNSTRTASSAPYERRPSESASKQGSGSSTRNVSGEVEPRLAPITDEGPSGQWTDEPQQSLSPQESTNVPKSHTPATQNTLESQTGQTMWSQESADRSEASTPTTTHPHPGKAAQAALPPLIMAQQGNDRQERLPELPNDMATPLAKPIPITATEPSTGSNTPPAEAPEVHSPTPRKVSSREPISPTRSAIQNEPAAQYLMNMVDEPHQVPPTAPTAQQTTPPKEDRVKSPSESGSGSGVLPTIGRKPSGARAPPPKKSSTGATRSLSSVDESGRSPLSPPPISPPVSAVRSDHTRDAPPSAPQDNDLPEDASAYMAYAEQPSPEKGKGKEMPPPPPPEPVEEEPRSSFAPSKAVAERRARAEAAAAEQERAKYVPGGGKRTGPAPDHTWSDSEEEDEEEEQDSPEIQKRVTLPDVPQAQSRMPEEPSLERSSSRARALPTIPRPAPNGGPSEYRDRRSPLEAEQQRQRPHSRSPHPPPMHEQYQPRHSQYQQQPQPRSHYEAQYRQSQAPPPQQQQQHQNRHTVWNANFAAEHGMPENKTGKFIELEEPSAQLTKAFSPHGLLQAGIQDKEDRSAKRQEELARETGSSLINVPAKPPPPQTGLLGAVAAHERDRKNAGGIGATLTDREREKRQNEDRQREMDKQNRQHMDQMRQYGGDPYGGGGQQHYPYGMPPMMMGMPPMGYSGYQGGYNPYAQQQAMMAAQMAYQQAMMSMSQHGGGGSQAGGGHTPDRPSSPASMHGQGQGQSHLAPPAGGFGGYYPPPQMSPYGWPGMMPTPPWGGGSPAAGSPMGPPNWFPPHVQGEGTQRSRGVSMYSEDGGQERDKSRDRGPVN